jgi:DNA modification methylase
VTWSILQHDVKATPWPIEPESVQCVVTSPPYFGLRDYGADGQIGLERTPAEYVERVVHVFREVRRVLRKDGTVWLNVGDCFVSRPNSGHGWEKSGLTKAGGLERKIQVGQRASTSKHRRFPGLKYKDLIGIPWRIAFALQDDGWWLRFPIVWEKPNTIPESVKDRPTLNFEFVFLLSKSARYHYDPKAIREPYDYGRDHHRNVDNPPVSHVPGAPRHTGLRRSGNVARKTEVSTVINNHRGYSIPWVEGEGRNARGVWRIATQPFPEAHHATMAPELARRCILAGSRPGDLVLDPFAGAGTTILVADRLRRHAIGLEISPEYVAMSQRRLRDDAPLFQDDEPTPEPAPAQMEIGAT